MSRKTITFAITVCTELLEITRLLNFIQPRILEGDEILIQYDSENVSSEVLDYLNIVEKLHKNHTIIGFPLHNDFASFKNHLKSHCNGDYIVQIDADEEISEYLIENLGFIIETNPVDLIFMPRINTVCGITELHVKRWGWEISKLESQIGEKNIDNCSDEYLYLKKLGYIIEEVKIDTTNVKIKYYIPIINKYDYQTRIYKNTDDITWYGKVHEQISGYSTFSNLPTSNEWCLYHHKTITKQEKQNLFYETICHR